MTDKNLNTDEVTPESLMNAFHGPGLSKMMIVTIIVHVVVILGTSVPFMLHSVLVDDTSKLSKEERIDKAMVDVTGELQKIADEPGLRAQEIGDLFAKGNRPQPTTAPVVDPEMESEPETTGSPMKEPEKPKSTIEQELEKKASGPSLPDVSSDIEEEDLFK